MNLTCVHMYAESQTNRRRHHREHDPVHLVCVVSSSLLELASLGHLSSSALLRGPVRLFIAATQVGVSQDVSSPAFSLQPGSPGGFTTTQFPVK